MDRGDPQLVSRARGALLGLVAGNQLGVPTEHLGTPEAIRKAFPNGVVDLAPPPKNSPYDDDAAMALLLGESLLASKGFDANDVARRALREAIHRVPRERESDLPIARAGEAGYVVHCVEIAFWFATHHRSLEEALIALA